MRRKFNTRQRNYIILGLCSILLIMVAGYAAFRSQLNIKGTSNITSEWNVLISNIQSQVLSGTPEDEAGSPSHTNTTANFSTKLYSPGDRMQYTVTVENRGSLDAVLKTIENTNSSNEAIIFTINGIEQGDTLKAKESKTFTVDVEYNSEVESQPSNLTSNLEVTLNYVQAGTDDEGTVLPTETNLMRSYSDGSQADYHNDAYREKITSIEFLNNKNIPSEAVQSWDVSERQDGSVMAWIINDQENEGFYKLYIGGDGGVVANPNSGTLFAYFKQTKTIDLSNLDTSNVTYMMGMFSSDENLISINFGDNFDTSKVTNMAWMFTNCNNLVKLDLSSFNTANVTIMMGMFSGCSSLTELDLSNFDTHNVTNMNAMFQFDESLERIKFNVMFDTLNVTTMQGMFNSCSNLRELDLSSFDTSNVVYMNEMFRGCSSLISLNLSSFDTSKVTNMSAMFNGCSNITSLNLNNFDTSHVTSMSQMFENSKFTSLDLSSFDTSNVTDMYAMFNGTTDLQTIYVGPKWSTDGTNTYLMFNNCGTDHVTLKSN